MTDTIAAFEAARTLLAEWGHPVKSRVGWRRRTARTDIAFTPVGVVNHHTASWETSNSMLYGAAGNGVVGGPLCHWSIDRDGTIRLGAAGYANHAGINHKASVEALLAGLGAEHSPGADTAGYSANRRTVGVEVKCPGAYNAAQRLAAVALNAALVIAFGWSQDRPPIGAHKEITRRKPGDPGDDMGAFRAEVAALVAEKAAPPVPALLAEDGVMSAAVIGAWQWAQAIDQTGVWDVPTVTVLQQQINAAIRAAKEAS